MPWLFVHWPPKLLCICHIYVWQCDPSSMGSKYVLKSLGHLWSILWHASHGFKIILAMCRFIVYSNVCMMVKDNSTTSGHIYNHLMENEAKQLCFIDLPQFGFSRWSSGPYPHAIKHHMICKKHNLFVWNSTCWHQITRYVIWHLSSMAKVVPNCCVFYIFCVATFLKMFHSTRVCKSLHSPSKNS
jgi:hypothetical protein